MQSRKYTFTKGSAVSNLTTILSYFTIILSKSRMHLALIFLFDPIQHIMIDIYKPLLSTCSPSQV